MRADMTRRLVTTAWLLCASLFSNGGFTVAAVAQPADPEPGGGPPGIGWRGPHGPPPIEQLRKLLDGDSPKLDDVMQWADRIGAAETELKKSRLHTMLEIRTLLTPEQRQKLVKIFEQRRGHWKGFEGNAPPPGPQQ
jgi:Spy/CpxP family protein refolding chaperone